MSNFSTEYKPTFKKKLNKIKDGKDKQNIINKINEIKDTVSNDNIDHYKNLRKPLNEFKRVHVNTNFVMIFKIDVDKKIITFYNYDHHDKIYYSSKNFKE